MELLYVSVFCGATQMTVLLLIVQRVSFDVSKLVAASVVSVTELGSGGRLSGCWDLPIQGVTRGTDQTSGECSLGQTVPI